ncbi:MAG: hypothetical protein HRU49_14415 [Winogradskyella sp.]|uniref:hypothetical protein n=1 Tax=Winogradskyella sp. TaxID=1883156 RepID=UPI0025DD26B0|nr:hypothetical protein [Winogradskyella sp.]NRB84942.1 hypothetical protein [Winogradskyella sp.]
MKNYIAALIEIIMFSTILLLPCYLSDNYQIILITWIPAFVATDYLKSARDRNNNQEPFG